MRKSPFVLLVTLLTTSFWEPSMADSSTSPGLQSPIVAEVLALQDRMNDAALRGDGAAFEDFLSEDLVVSDPSNTIRHRDDMIALFSSGRVSYTSVDTTIDYAARLGDDFVVVMGTEATRQTSVPEDTGLQDVAAKRTLNRRFTNVFRKEDGAWRLVIKQSTIFSFD